VALELIIGPAHAGKIDELYRRYLVELAAGRQAPLVVPDRAAQWVTERELLLRAPSVIGADVVTFDTLFERVLKRTQDTRPLLRSAARRALLRRALPEGSEALGMRLDRLGSGLLAPSAVRAAGDEVLADRYDAWWQALDRVGAVDRGRMRLDAVAALRDDVAAWPDGMRLFAQGFDDLSAAQEALLDVVAQRAGVVVSLPYEAGRPPFAVLTPVVARLAERAGGNGIVELSPGAFDRHPDLALLERRLGEPAPDSRASAPSGDGIAVGEVEGERGEAEVVVHEIAEALRAGTHGSRIAVVAPHGADGRARLLRQLREAGIAVVANDQAPLGRTPFGRALLALLRLAWADEPSDDDRLAWLQSPWSGAPRHLVDRCERQVRRSLMSLEAALDDVGEPLRRALALPAGVRGGGSPIDEGRAEIGRAHV
jgi:hypothetical protein